MRGTYRDRQVSGEASPGKANGRTRGTWSFRVKRPGCASLTRGWLLSELAGGSQKPNERLNINHVFWHQRRVVLSAQFGVDVVRKP